MDFKARILRDSVNPERSRITTCELTYPRCIHSEFMTHRMFSRNAASSRAIPVTKMLRNIEEHPFVPIHWGINQKGMQAYSQLEGTDADNARLAWLTARDAAVANARTLLGMDLHKQLVNRIVEPWMWITVIATGNTTAFENFFKLRCHHAAEPHIQKLAYLLRDAFDESVPNELDWGDHHLPLTGFDGDDTLSIFDLVKVGTARCARVSYLTHDGIRDVAADLGLHDNLRDDGHWSPFEHVAQAKKDGNGGNLGSGWLQYRKLFATEVCHQSER